MREFDFVVFMGRFQPLHNGHLHVINRALQLADKVVILVGSANLARSPRNPFTYSERRQMLLEASTSHMLEDAEGRLLIQPVPDQPYNDAAWIATVQHTVAMTMMSAKQAQSHVGLIGHKKDSTSYYLKLFPEWKGVDVTTQYGTLSSTDLREMYLRRAPQLPDTHLVPAPVRTFLTKFMLTEPFKWLVAEEDYYKAYRKSWEGTPWPIIITCVDAVVVQSGHILLVRRGDTPGKGLLALPGGHVGQLETFREAVVRELKEETRIADTKGEIPPAMLASFIEDSKTRLFDAPHRSDRARVVTQGYYFALPNRTTLFSVRGDDDAQSASWYPLGSLRANDFHDDHAAIITEMTGYSLTADWEV